jgi:hypothetical protein
MGTVGLDFFSGRGVDPMSVGKTFGDGFGEVQFFRGKEVTKQTNILGGIVKSLGNKVGRETVDKGSTEGLIPTVPVQNGMGKKGSILHKRCYTI